MTELLLDLPFPPSLNTYYRNVHGRTLLSAKGREYKQDVLVTVHRLGKSVGGSCFEKWAVTASVK